MTIYYVNAASGSDSNSGASADHALASLNAVNALKLKAGDSVLFASGSEYEGQLTVKYSGSVDKPITYGSYGDGEPPVLAGGSVGIYGTKAANIVVENIAIENTVGNAIYAGSASNWVIHNVTVSDTGSALKSGSISFQNSTSITITDSHVTGTHGDGIWMLNVKGATLTGNTVTNAVGHDADAIQLNGTSNIVITNNTLDMSGNTGSAKGVLVLVDAKDAVIDGNTLTGGGFGLAAYGENITITHNEISDYKGYSWSYGIGLGQQVDAKGYVISDNYIHDGVWGVSISASGTDTLTRTGIDISGNVFEDLSSSALKVDRIATGSFHDNMIAGTVNGDVYLSSTVAQLGTFHVTASAIVADVVSAADHALGRDVTASVPTLDDTVSPPIADAVPAVDAVPVVDRAPVEQAAPVADTAPADHAAPAADTAPAAAAAPQTDTSYPASTGAATPVVDTTHQAAATPVEAAASAAPETVPAAPIDQVSLIPLPSSSTSPTTTHATTTVPDTSIHAMADVLRFDGGNGLSISGNVLDNDHSGNGIMSLVGLNGAGFKKMPVMDVAGKFGTLHIEKDGDFTFTLDVGKLSGASGIVSESFQYKISNGVHIDADTINVLVDVNHVVQSIHFDHLL